MSNTFDDADIQREITNVCQYKVTNTLIRKFSKRSAVVKTVLFKTYCVCLYDGFLWKRYNLGTLDKVRSCVLLNVGLIQYFIMLLPHSCMSVSLVQITLLCICVTFSFRRECVFTVFIVYILHILCIPVCPLSIVLWALLPDLK